MKSMKEVRGTPSNPHVIPLVRLGGYMIHEDDLYKRIVDKIPKKQFASIVKDIQSDLDGRKA